MKARTVVASDDAAEKADRYDLLEKAFQTQIDFILHEPLFMTSVDPNKLWDAYLNGIPEERRQHYNCHACRDFIKKYGGLVTIDGAGRSMPAVLPMPETTFPMFADSLSRMHLLVMSAKVCGVFYSEERVWGKPVTGEWTHLSGTNGKPFKSTPLKNTEQAMAEKMQDYIMLVRGLADFAPATVVEAVRVLRSDLLERSEKAISIAEWLMGVHATIANTRGTARTNHIWKAVAEAPPGFAHVRSTMISTLLDDIVNGQPFDAIKAKWSEKMHPLQYQRPTAAPKEGQIDQAEKIFEALGASASLQRRFATLDDILVKMWTPKPIQPKSGASDGVFGSLRNKVESPSVKLPAQNMSWEKFLGKVLPDANKIEVYLPFKGHFVGMLTAVHPDSPPILQWDGLPGLRRNPVSWYMYHGGSSPGMWGLSYNAFANVSAVFDLPHKWQLPAMFSHQIQDMVVFALDDCKDQHKNSGSALFPELLRGEFRECRSVIEAYSKANSPVLGGIGNANGIAFQGGGKNTLSLKVTDDTGIETLYNIVRWD